MKTKIKVDPQIASEAVDILLRAKDYIAQGWTQGAEARNKYSNPISPMNNNAVRWCAVGALARAQADLYQEIQPMDLSLPNVGQSMYVIGNVLTHRGRGIVSINDRPDTTKEDVLDCFDEAIRTLKDQL